MAAPSSVFLTPTFNCYNNGTTVSHFRAIPTDSVSTLKTRFYLDELFVSVDASGNQGFTGICYPSTLNYDMHNINRIGNGRYKGNGAMFNDAGLNTKGICDNGTVLSTVFTGVQVKINYKSAYYVSSDITGIRLRLWNPVGGTWEGWTDNGGSTLPSNTIEDRIFSLGFEMNENLRTKGFQVQPYITNVEGTYYGAISATIYPTGVINTVYAVWGGSGTNFYANSTELNDAAGDGEPTRFFTNEGLTTPYLNEAGNKFYYADKQYLLYGYSALWDYYCILSFGTDVVVDPIYPPVSYIYKGYHYNNQYNAEDQVLFNVGSNTGTIYFDEYHAKAYKSYSGTYPDFVYGAYADEGYYVQGNTVMITRVVYVDSAGNYTDVDPINM